MHTNLLGRMLCSQLNRLSSINGLCGRLEQIFYQCIYLVFSLIAEFVNRGIGTKKELILKENYVLFAELLGNLCFESKLSKINNEIKNFMIQQLQEYSTNTVFGKIWFKLEIIKNHNENKAFASCFEFDLMQP